MGRDERSKGRILGLDGRPARAVTGLPGGVQAPRLRDTLGRVLEIGDEVLLMTPCSRMRVALIGPVLDPGAPPNTVLLTLVAQERMAAPSNANIEGLYRVRHAAEMGGGATAVEAPPEQPTDTGDEIPLGDESGAATLPTQVDPQP